MHIMAGRTRDSVPVHDALHKVVALHAILVRGAVGEVVERRLTEGAVLELPEVLQSQPHVVADRPIVVSVFDRIRQEAGPASGIGCTRRFRQEHPFDPD